MKKNRNRLCTTCLNMCEKELNEKKCGKYCGFEQIRIFVASVKHNKAPRESWEEYGIIRERYIQLRDMIRSGKYDAVAREAAYTADKDIAEYILLSVKENLSYEGVEYSEQFGRIPCGRTDFYGYRRLFYHLLNKKIIELEE